MVRDIVWGLWFVLFIFKFVLFGNSVGYFIEIGYVCSFLIDYISVKIYVWL